MDYSEFERSGTAPTRTNSKTPPPTTRVRPKTRSGVSGTTELSDLNMSLKMEKRNGANNEDPVEDFHFAIENWEKTRKFKQNDPQTNSRKTNSAYTRSDPVSMAYSSQFKPIKSGSPKTSPRANRSKAKAVAEIQAAYGISQPASNNSSTSQEQTTTTATSTSATTVSKKNSKDLKSSFQSNESESTGLKSSSPLASLISDELRYQQQQQQTTTATDKERSNEVLQPHPPRTNPQRSQTTTVSQSAQSSGSATVSSQSKSGYRRRSDQTRAAPSMSDWKETSARLSGRPPSEGPIERDRTKESLIVNVSPTGEFADDEEYAPFTLGISDSTSSGLSYPYESDSNPRPQSRKLYLGGNTGSPRTTNLEFPMGENSSHDAPSHHGGMRAPRSAGSLPRHNILSPELRPSNSTTEANFDHHSNPNIILSSPWHGNSTNFDDRPPSRQRTAFPVHLADREHKRLRTGTSRNDSNPSINLGGTNSALLNSNSNPNRKGAFIDADEVVEVNTTNTLRGGGGGGGGGVGSGGMKLATNANDLLLESPSGRPPSRQKIGAQYLWGDEALFEQEMTGHSKLNHTDHHSPDALVSPLLTPSISACGISLIESEIYSRASSSPSLQMNPSQSMNNNYERGDKSRGSMAPMYDPTADGFTQLENRSQSAPFKIRFNHSTKKPSYTSGGGSSGGGGGGGSRRHKDCNSPLSNSKSATSLSSPGKSSNFIQSQPYHGNGSGGASNLTVGGGGGGGESTTKEQLTRSRSSENIEDDGMRSNLYRTNRRSDYSSALGFDDPTGLEEDLTILTMYSDDDEEYDIGSNNFHDSQTLILESSLGQDFLNLFAPGR